MTPLIAKGLVSEIEFWPEAPVHAYAELLQDLAPDFGHGDPQRYLIEPANRQ